MNTKYPSKLLFFLLLSSNILSADENEIPHDENPIQQEVGNEGIDANERVPLIKRYYTSTSTKKSKKKKDYYSQKIELEETTEKEKSSKRKAFLEEEETIEIQNHSYGYIADKKTTHLKSLSAHLKSNRYISASGKQFPAQVRPIINNLKKIIDLKKNCLLQEKYVDFNNLVVLQGPPGNGKTKLVEIIKNESGSNLIRIAGSNISGYRYGEGKDTIKKAIKKALKSFEKTGKPVIIFVDEVDRIGTEFKSENREQEKDAFTQLWLAISKYKGDPRVLFVVASNKGLEKFAPAFVSRALSHRIILENPDKEERKNFLSNYFKKRKISLSDGLLDQIVSATESFSYRDLKAIVKTFKEFHKNYPGNHWDITIIWHIITEIKNTKETMQTEDTEENNEKNNRRMALFRQAHGLC